MFWSRNFYVETGLSDHGQNSGCRRTASERDAVRKESLEQSVEIIGKTERKKKSRWNGNKKGSNQNERDHQNCSHSKTTPKTGNAASEAPSGAERLARLSRSRSLILSLECLFSLHSLNGIPLCSQITVFVYILKNKKRNRGTRGKRRRPVGAEWPACPRWENKTGVVGFILESLQILVRNFYVGNTGISAIFTWKSHRDTAGSTVYLRRSKGQMA